MYILLIMTVLKEHLNQCANIYIRINMVPEIVQTIEFHLHILNDNTFQPVSY